MSLTKLIFSENINDRIKLHLLFWAFWYVYILITHAANPFDNTGITYFKYPEFTLIESFVNVLGQVPTVYVMLYFVFPRLILKRKILLGFVCFLLLWFICGALTLILLKKVMLPFLETALTADKIPKLPENPGNFLMVIMSTNKGASTIVASALMIKFGKHWYHKQYRNLQLQKENTEAQLQLLTAQVHPHFLFNTLNNIYSKTQTESPIGSRMIMSLSDVLRYILYEGSKLYVPLKQELTMITEYIKLEQMRYGNQLEVHMQIQERTEDIYIAPLLLLPFVENCFRHDSNSHLQNPWISLTVELKNDTMVMKLMNGKTPEKESSQINPGIGISNVCQRLELLYKDKYELKILDDEEVFVVDLQIELTKLNYNEEELHTDTNSTIAYA